MPSNCLLLGLCFIHPILKQSIQDRIGQLSPQEQLNFMDKIKLTQDVLANFIQSTVHGRIDPNVLTNEHLLAINQSADEQLFFESWPEEGKSNNIHPHVAKKKVLLNNKNWIDSESSMFEAVYTSIVQNN